MGQKKDITPIRYGTHHGELKFGHIHDDNNQSGVMLRTGPDGGRHYMTMDTTGSQTRKGGTINKCPGTYQIIAGEDVPKDIPGVYFEAESGDLVLRAPKGRIRIDAINIDIRASGSGGGDGVIVIDANEKVIVKAPTIDIDSKVSTKIFSEKTVELIGSGILNIYGGLIDCADGATKINGSKGGPYNNETRFKK
jgi:hypothetical protein